ncbi:helix-turn-helix transcriptional regulator [Streptomyces sp. LHD-70]|uniref:helix-turn-helix domain-containing protein n=1 Tax=Streptomyces sp. LHD-70 TaxID=3072140 RepID=UPI00280EF302|nr:helix-turn-helix transcriptional regulator [Streptomyces sp. LHD-70]MDQ8704870.1 helix-turn-helix transcriptional regulator [Streptomyces sp. LHD-70]
MSPSSPVSSVQQAQKALGQRLREIRKDRGLTARALAAAAGWHESKASRLENGKTPPSDDDIRTYTRLCHAWEQEQDLIATARGIEGMYIEWRRLERSGLKRVQQSVLPLFERTNRFLFYQSWVVPGLLQTPEYTRAVLNTAVSLRGAPDDVEDALQVRVDRQQVLHTRPKQFAMLLEEWVLRTVIGDADVMATQLGHLIASTALPSVSLGIIPMGVPRGDAWPTESFTVYDNAQTCVELVSANLTVTQPGEIGDYLRTFSELSNIAVYGAAARKLITKAIDAVG